MEGGALKQDILRKCRDLDIPLAGFAPADRWETPLFEPWVPEAFWPRSIFPEAKTVIVIGLPVSLPVLDTSPSIWYHELYKTVNILLDQHGYRIGSFLTERGYPSVWIPRDGYGSIEILKEKPITFFSHRHAALLAGLGNFGISNTILTPEYGPRVRFASIFTAADLPPDPLTAKPLCTRCMRCAEACPVNAVDTAGYPASPINKAAYAARSEALNRRALSPCGICIKVCPVGTDRRRYGREEMGVYDEHDPSFSAHRLPWKHVRSYGSRQGP